MQIFSLVRNCGIVVFSGLHIPTLLQFFFSACIETYLETLLAGFGGSPNMVSGTIIAISKIIYEYRGIMSLNFYDILI